MATSLTKLAMQAAVIVPAATGVGMATGIVPNGWVTEHVLPALEKQVAFLVPDEKEKPLERTTIDAAKSPISNPIKQKVAEPKTVLKTTPEKKPEVRQPKIPKFDVLRVEQDGSVLVAGQADANAKVELFLPDGTIVGQTKAGPEGDFVILPDQPLAPGDYVMGLQATDRKGTKITSRETSVVQVPEPGGEVLAMVSPEGQISRVIAKPSAPEVVALKPVEQEPAAPELASKPIVSEGRAPANKLKKQPFKEVQQPKLEVPVAPDKPDGVAKLAPANKPEVVAKVEAPEKPKVKGEFAVKLPKVDLEVAKKVDLETAKVNPETVKAPALPKKVIEAPTSIVVVVEAVEIENGTLFVAGAVPNGKLVRIYIDNQVVGLARGTRDNRFLLSKKFHLTEGEHSVRADVVERTSGKVLARAEVPLVHEVQLVEKPEPKKLKKDYASVAAPSVDLSVLKGKPSPSREFGRVKTPILRLPEKQIERIAKIVLPDYQSVILPSVPVAESKVVQPKKEVRQAFTDIKIPKLDSSPVKENSKPRQDFNAVKIPKVESKKVAKVVLSSPTKPDYQDVQTPGIALPVLQKDEVEKPLVGDYESIEMPKVNAENKTSQKVTPIRTGRAIIIKPGDNLWRISRKTYGRGIRYTTIYNANRDQIRDPNRIYIGQIFKIPETSPE